MSAIPTYTTSTQAVTTSELLYPLTVEQYHQLIRSGTLSEDAPVELLEGLLVFKMPKNTPHSSSTKLVRREFDSRLPSGWHLISQDPITLSDGEPEPDAAVVRGVVEDYFETHPTPTDVALVIEIADSSLERDRGIKLRSYARAGVTVYWIVNLVDRVLEVYTEPRSPDRADPYYAKRQHFTAGETVSFALPDGPTIEIPVSGILPGA